tara:strand:+ start:8643 stop:9404 length:762 start_codon:yes stop_codon:yes gene_type:complete
MVSGGFDPIHSGHISYFKAAKDLGNYLIVALNSDQWLQNKKGKFFLPFHERKIIIENMALVDEVISFEDDSEGSASLALEKVKKLYPNDHIIFCNGGDRNSSNTAEMKIKGIEFAFGVGGDSKMNSSSWILQNYFNYTEDRIWGKFSHLFNCPGVRVKDLVIDSNKGMSFQKHFKRNEIWFIYKGSCIVNHSKNDPENYKEITLNKDETMFIKANEWHQIINPFSSPCHIIEIQYGKEVSEEDIKRLYFYDKN